MWYVNRAGAVQGPISDEELRAAGARGELAGTHVARAGTNEWVPAETVLGGAPAAAPHPGGFAGGTQAMPQAPMPPQAPQGAYGPPPQPEQPPQGYGQPQQPYAQPPQGYAAPPQGYAAPPQGYAAPQQGYAPPQQGYGPPQQGYGQPYAGSAVQPGFAPQGEWNAQPQGVPASGGKKRGAFIAAIAGAGVVVALLLVGGIYGIASFMKKPAAHLAENVPANTSVYVETPSFKRSLLSLATMKIIDTSKLDQKTTTDSFALALSNAFDIPKTDALALILSLDASAIAGHDPTKTGDGSLLLAVGSAGPMETLLKSYRFTAAGNAGKTGKVYTVARAPAATPPPPRLEETLRYWSTNGPRDKVVWFTSKKLLFIGSADALKDVTAVIEDGAPSLETNETYKKAKSEFESNADVVMFFDEKVIQQSAAKGTPDQQRGANAYFKNGGPMDGDVKISSAGTLLNGHFVLSGDGLPQRKSVDAAVKLTYPRKLPDDTMLYFAASTKTSLKGTDAKAELIKSMQGTDPEKAREMTEAIDKFEAESGFTVADLFDMLGDEAAFAVMVDKTFAYSGGNWMALGMSAVKSIGAAYVMQVDDDAVAKRVLAKVQAKMKDPEFAKATTLKTDADGFTLDVAPEAAAMIGGQAPSLRMKYAKKELSIVVAQKAMADRFYGGLDGSNKATLKNDDAHELAMGALRTNAHAYVWLDLGRLTTLAYAANPEDREDAKKFGVPVDAIKLTGPERITTAMDFTYRIENDAWHFDVETLNLGGFALFAGVEPPGGARSSFGGPSALIDAPSTSPTSPTSLTGTTTGTTTTTAPAAGGQFSSLGVPSCDAYLHRLSSCGTGAQHDAYARSAKQTHDSWSKIPISSRKGLANACTQMNTQLDKSPGCNK